MKRVRQTQFGETKGNCFQAALASLLEEDLRTVPPLHKYPRTWFGVLNEWMEARGKSFLETHYDKHLTLATGQLALLTGKSPRGDYRHCVIGRYDGTCWALAWDPHPSDDGLDGEPEFVSFVMPINPV